MVPRIDRMPFRALGIFLIALLGADKAPAPRKLIVTVVTRKSRQTEFINLTILAFSFMRRAISIDGGLKAIDFLLQQGNAGGAI
jgi:hypothetical protein